MASNDIDPKILEEYFVPFDGEFTVSVDQHKVVYVEDVNGQTVCVFNKHTQLPLTDANMEWEFNFWLDRAKQICDMLNESWWNGQE